VKLADVHGVNRTALVLKLDYYSLRKRVTALNVAATSATPAFVEFSPPPLASSGDCVIEFEDGAGASMRVHLRGCEAPDLAALSRSFWSSD
jgi:hypothetical protein